VRGNAAAASWWRRGGTIFGARAADALLRFLLFLATARVLSAADFSLYALLTAALGLGQTLASFGSPRTASYHHARGERGRLFGWLFLVAAGLSALFVAAAASPPIRERFFPEVSAGLLLLGLAPLPFVLLSDSLASTLLAAHRERAYAAHLIVRTTGIALVLAASLASDERLRALLFGRLVVYAAVAVLLAALTRARPDWRAAAAYAPEALRFAGPAAASSGLIALHRRADVLLLSAFGRTNEIGGYALAYGFSETVWMVSDSLEAALFPDLTRLPDPEARRVAGEALRRYAVGAAAIFLLGLLAGGWILRTVFADRQPEASRLFPLALAGAVAWGATRPAASYLYSRGRVSTLVALHAIGVAVNLVLCLLWIPAYGALGAAAATAASYAFEAAVLLLRFHATGRTPTPS
jgi:O-antigen/teichoic acid export membrane protein